MSFDRRTPSNAEVKERVEVYRYSICGTSWPGIGLINFTFTSWGIVFERNLATIMQIGAKVT
jgi:hypothetical protein